MTLLAKLRAQQAQGFATATVATVATGTLAGGLGGVAVGVMA